MRPPRSFRILGQRYRVDNPKTFKDPEDGESLLGHIDHDYGLVTVSGTQSPDQMAETFLHEVLHALLDKVGHGSNQMGAEEHEAMVNRLAPVLLLFLRDNPRVIEYLTGRVVGGRRAA